MVELNPKMSVQELLDRYPRAISVFIKRRMLCVGCPTGAFHTVEDVARIHGYRLESLLSLITDALQAEGPSSGEAGRDDP